ncbi:MAG: amino acid--tRNA ligase-related protein, partial [Elusimicrobiota bacterium]
VPSRLAPGTFYALPQSPQLFKQLLMVAGYDRYFQLARCFRDEDLRADRQPEHTQIDMEMSFVREGDIHAVVEGMLAAVFREALSFEIKTPFRSLDYAEALGRYGSDKPDLRFGLELVDLSSVFRGCGFRVFSEALSAGGVVWGLGAAGGSLSRAEIDKLVELAKASGAKGLAWARVKEGGQIESPLSKFMTAGELEKARGLTGLKTGETLLLA